MFRKDRNHCFITSFIWAKRKKQSTMSLYILPLMVCMSKCHFDELITSRGNCRTHYSIGWKQKSLHVQTKCVNVILVNDYLWFIQYCDFFFFPIRWYSVNWDSRELYATNFIWACYLNIMWGDSPKLNILNLPFNGVLLGWAPFTHYILLGNKWSKLSCLK